MIHLKIKIKKKVNDPCDRDRQSTIYLFVKSKNQNIQYPIIQTQLF